MDDVCPQCPSNIEIGLDFAWLVGEKAVEMLRQELPDVEQVGVHVAQDGVLRVVQAGLQDVFDNVLEGLCIVDV